MGWNGPRGCAPAAVLLAVAFVAAPVAARATTTLVGSLGVLADPAASPPDRASHLTRLCAPGLALDPGELVPGVRSLLASELRPARLAGARLAACRSDPALIPALYDGFLRERSSNLSDPDIYERLLRALQAYPIATLRDELADPDSGFGREVHGELLEIAWSRLTRNWLEPLAEGSGADLQPRLGPAANDVALAEASDWLERVLDAGPEGLVRLQADSGDHAFLFMERLQGWHLAAMITHGTLAEARLAVEVCMQSGLCDGAAAEALEARLGTQPDAELAERLTDMPRVREDPADIGLRMRPVTPLGVLAAPDEQITEVPGRWPLALVALLGLALFWLGWAAAARARPGWRRGLFPVGAVAIAPTGLLLAELCLAAAGVQPLAWRGAGGWSEPIALQGVDEEAGILLERQELGGEAWLVVGNSSARWTALREQKPPGTWRIGLVGESSAQAANYLAEESFLSVLGRRLRERHPDRPIELLNGGIGGAISDDILRAGRDAIDADVDVLILYHGINDLGRLETLAAMRAFTPLQLGARVLLDESRVARVMTDLLPTSLRRRWAAPEEGGGRLDRLGDEDGSRLQGLAALRCSRNQQRLVREARDNGVPVVVVSQAVLEREPGMEPASGGPSDLLRSLARDTAARSGAVFIDGRAVLRAHASAATGEARAGADYFWDDLHPSRLGHAVLGEALAPTVERLLLED